MFSEEFVSVLLTRKADGKVPGLQESSGRAPRSHTQPLCLEVFFLLVMPGAGMPKGRNPSNPPPFPPKTPQVYFLRFRVVVHDVGGSGSFWCVRRLFPGCLLFCSALPPHSSSAEVSSSAWDSLNLFSSSPNKCLREMGRAGSLQLFTSTTISSQTF